MKKLINDLKPALLVVLVGCFIWALFYNLERENRAQLEKELEDRNYYLREWTGTYGECIDWATTDSECEMCDQAYSINHYNK